MAKSQNNQRCTSTDLFGSNVIRPKTLETTALGAYLAGLVGYWKSVDDLQQQCLLTGNLLGNAKKK
jgi:glycerol kinase